MHMEKERVCVSFKNESRDMMSWKTEIASPLVQRQLDANNAYNLR